MEVGAIASLGTALSHAQFEAEFAVAALSAQLNVAQDAGQNAVRLIQSATLDPSVGQALDLRV